MKFSKYLLTVFLIFSTAINGAAVTYEFSGGRFGDNILAYLHAKWISFKYNIPLLYKPFKYSDKLTLHYKEIEFDKKLFKDFPIKVLTKKDMDINPNLDVIYVVPYFSEIAFERNLPWNKHWIDLDINWCETNFCNEIKEFVKPINESLLNLCLPKDCITVAVHVRKGAGFDGPLLSEDNVKRANIQYADLNAPLKFPPEYYYVEQLKKISEIFNHKKIYAHVFTDDASPLELIERFKNQLNDFPNIIFNCRKEESDKPYDSNVLEDFFALTKFDCLVGCQSSYSIAASKITDYKVKVFPVAHHWEGARSIIDKVEITVKD